MRATIIANYNLRKKDNSIYNKKYYTEEERKNTIIIRLKILEFIRKVNHDDNLRVPELDTYEMYDYITDKYPYYGINYLENIGYISKCNYDRDLVNVYFYGTTLEEAFKRAIVEYSLDNAHVYELHNREQLNQDYSNRFLDGSVKKDDYHGPFFFAELSLQTLREYYEDNIPEDIINMFEKYTKDIANIDVQYDYESNGFVKPKTKIRKFHKVK